MNVPTVKTLRDAVDKVIDNNKSEGYPPTRFMEKVGDKMGSELRMACEELLFSEIAERAVINALPSYPKMWTLEDFVTQQGASWGFGPEALRAAHRRVKDFDAIRTWGMKARGTP